MAAVRSEAAQDSTTQEADCFLEQQGGTVAGTPALLPGWAASIPRLSDKEKPVRAQEEASQGGMSHLGKVEEDWGIQANGRLGRPLEL